MKKYMKNEFYKKCINLMNENKSFVIELECSESKLFERNSIIYNKKDLKFFFNLFDLLEDVIVNVKEV